MPQTYFIPVSVFSCGGVLQTCGRKLFFVRFAEKPISAPLSAAAAHSQPPIIQACGILSFAVLEGVRLDLRREAGAAGSP